MALVFVQIKQCTQLTLFSCLSCIPRPPSPGFMKIIRAALMMHSNRRCEIFMKAAFMSSSPAASGPAADACSYHSDTAGGSSVFGFPRTFHSRAFPGRESQSRDLKKKLRGVTLFQLAGTINFKSVYQENCEIGLHLLLSLKIKLSNRITLFHGFVLSLYLVLINVFTYLNFG